MFMLPWSARGNVSATGTPASKSDEPVPTEPAVPGRLADPFGLAGNYVSPMAATERVADVPPPDVASSSKRGALEPVDVTDALRAANQRLRRERDTARADADREARHRRAVQAERDTALARVDELDRVVHTLGDLIIHAAGHDTTAGAR